MEPQLSFSGTVAAIRLDAPERRNALTPDDLRTLAAAIAEIERSDARVAILRAGGDTFCSGYDLNALRSEIRGASDGATAGAFARVVDALENLRVPTICALQGGAYGGGSDLALACDLRIGTAQTALAIPVARFGLQFYSGGLRRYVERLGLDAAKRIFLLAERIDARELLRIGFLQELVEADELDARVDALAARVSEHAPEAVRGLKRSINAIARGVGDPDVIDDAFVASLRSDESLGRMARP